MDYFSLNARRCRRLMIGTRSFVKPPAVVPPAVLNLATSSFTESGWRLVATKFEKVSQDALAVFIQSRTWGGTNDVSMHNRPDVS